MARARREPEVKLSEVTCSACGGPWHGPRTACPEAAASAPFPSSDPDLSARPDTVRLRAPAIVGGRRVPVEVPRDLAELLYALGEDLGAEEVHWQLREALK